MKFAVIAIASVLSFAAAASADSLVHMPTCKEGASLSISHSDKQDRASEALKSFDGLKKQVEAIAKEAGVELQLKNQNKSFGSGGGYSFKSGSTGFYANASYTIKSTDEVKIAQFYEQLSAKEISARITMNQCK